MRINRLVSTLVSAAMGALIIAPIQPLAAEAATIAGTQKTLSISSGSLILFASGTQTYSNTGIAYSSTVSNGVAKNFFVNNSGNFSVSRFALIIVLPANSNVSAFKRCNINVSFTGTGVCASGSPATLSITPGTSTTYLLPTTPNSYYAFQIVQNKTGSIQVNTYANSGLITTSTTNS